MKRDVRVRNGGKLNFFIEDKNRDNYNKIRKLRG